MMTSRTRAGRGVKVRQLAIEGNSKRVLRRSITGISLLCGKTDRLHALIVTTRRGGVFISGSDGRIAYGAWR